MIRTQVEERFSSFFEKWMRQLEDYLPLLLCVSRNKQYHNDDDYDDDDDDDDVVFVDNGDGDGGQAGIQVLVNKVTALHKDYYTMKWASAHEDVLAFFTQVWLSPLENTLLWNTGWKPSIIFRLLESLIKSSEELPEGGWSASLQERDSMMISESQMRKIECLKARIRVEEEEVDREMERQQVAMADRRMVELVRLESPLKTSGEQHPTATTTAARVDGLVEAAVRELIAGLERVMKMADCVRLKTLKGVLDVLNPIQSVDLLASLSMLQIQMRKWGKKRQL